MKHLIYHSATSVYRFTVTLLDSQRTMGRNLLYFTLLTKSSFYLMVFSMNVWLVLEQRFFSKNNWFSIQKPIVTALLFGNFP